MHRLFESGLAVLVAVACGACTVRTAGGDGSPTMRAGHVRPGITVLLDDSIQLVRGKRVGLLTNQAGVDEAGRSDIDLLASDKRAREANVHLVALFSPEHGIRITEDHTNIPSGRDDKTGLPIYSLYTVTTVAPPDSTLRNLDVVVFDLQDIGTRTWTYVGNLVYTLRAVKRNHLPLVVLDRPAPLTGVHRDGPMLDTVLSNPEDHSPTRSGQAYALYPFPLRHGMTMGELALFYNDVLGIGAELHVVPMRGWRRAMWFDQTGLVYQKPSPNLPSLTSALIYPALVPFERSNMTVGRGTSAPFQRLGAPWLDATATAALLNDRALPGVRFVAERFTSGEGERKYGGQEIPGIRIEVTDRDRVHAGRVGAALLWAIAKTAGDSLRLNAHTFDLRFGNSAAREALLRGEDPDAVIDRDLPGVVAFETNARKYFLYR